MANLDFTSWDLYQDFNSSLFVRDKHNVCHGGMLGDNILATVTGVIFGLRWTYLTILHDRQSGMNANTFAYCLHQKGVMTSSYCTDRGENILPSLWKRRDPDIHILLMGSEQFILSVLKMADRFDNRFENIRTTAMFYKSYWIVLSKMCSILKFETLWKNMNLDNVLVIDTLKKERPIILTLMWRNNQIREFEILHHSNTNIFPNDKHGFNGRKLLVAGLEWEGMVEITNKSGHMEITDGICGELAHILSDNLNFTYEVVKPEDREWGNLKQNDTWTGIIGQLQRKEVDIAMVPLTVQEIRRKVVDFTIPIFYEESAFMVKMDTLENKRWSLYLKPFSLPVLIVICVVFIASSLFLHLLEKYNTEKINSLGLQYRFTFSDTLLYMYGAVFLNAGRDLPKTDSIQIFISLYLIVCVSLSVLYCGSLVAYMAVDRREEHMPFTTLEELVDQTEYKWGYIGGTYRDVILQKSTLPVFTSLYNGINRFYMEDKDVLSVDSKIHFEKVLTEKYVYISDVTSLATVVYNDCSLALSTERFMIDRSAFGLPKHSPFTDLFSKKLSQIQNSGVFSQIQEKHRIPDKCSSRNKFRNNPIQLKDVQSAFYILLLGIVLAMIVLCTEYITYHKKKER